MADDECDLLIIFWLSC